MATTPMFDDLIQAAISISGGGISKTSFGVGNFASFHPYTTERIKYYSNTTAVALDFPTTSVQYLAAVAYFSQQPAPSLLGISRLEVDAITVDVVGSAIYDDTFTYSIDINGNGPYTSVGAGSAILTATALVAAAVADPDTDWVDNADGTYDITIKASPATAAPFVLTSLDVKQGWVVKTEGETYTDGLTAIKAYSDAWYGLTIQSRVEADVLLTAAWTETNKKLFGTFSTDLEIINTTKAADTGSIAKQLQDLAYKKTFCGYHSKADGATNEQFIDMAVFGRNLTTDLDVQSSTYSYSQLTGITADNLTSTQILNATGTAEAPTSAKNANVYTPLTDSANTLQRGITCSGYFINLITTIDWTEIRIREGAAVALLNAKSAGGKLSFGKDLDVLPNVVVSVLKTGQDAESFAFNEELSKIWGFSVTWPESADIPAAEKSAGIQKNIVFVVDFDAAIQAVRYTGTVNA